MYEYTVVGLDWKRIDRGLVAVNTISEATPKSVFTQIKVQDGNRCYERTVETKRKAKYLSNRFIYNV